MRVIQVLVIPQDCLVQNTVAWLGGWPSAQIEQKNVRNQLHVRNCLFIYYTISMAHTFLLFRCR